MKRVAKGLQVNGETQNPHLFLPYESTQSEDKQNKHVASSSRTRKYCRTLCKNASGISHYCLIRRKAIKATASVFTIPENYTEKVLRLSAIKGV